MDDDDIDKKQPFSVADAHLWQKMTQDVERLQGRDYIQIDKKQKNDKKRVKKQPESLFLSKISIHKPKNGFEIDKRTETRLKRGQIPLDSRIDLHGMDQNQAKSALLPFIERCYAKNERCVLVVTGKGKENKGVLKQVVPVWLSEGVMGQIVLKAVPAQIKDGGAGALYVYLRRNRD